MPRGTVLDTVPNGTYTRDMGDTNIPTVPRLLGAALLEHFIRTNYRTVPAFCEARHVERTYVSRLIDGGRGGRMPVQMAVKIAAATDGYVPVESWAESVGPTWEPPALGVASTTTAVNGTPRAA